MNSSDNVCRSPIPECPISTQNTKFSVSCYIYENYVSRTFKFKYDTCKQENTAQWRGSNNFVCVCIKDLIHDCAADMYNNEGCQSVFQVIVPIQIVVILIALILNGSIFFKPRHFVRKYQICCYSARH